jgi:hypothetical protein
VQSADLIGLVCVLSVPRDASSGPADTAAAPESEAPHQDRHLELVELRRPNSE